jgi:galactosamine-6-phosphate isomerase
MSRHAADWLVERLRENSDALVCLASGNTPTRAYEILAAHYAAERKLFERMRAIKLDEWGGLAMDDPGSCEHHLRRTVIDPLGLNDRYVAFDGQSPAPADECDRIARWLAENGPIDLCVLGLGVNGHLGFNEPGPILQPHAHLAQLSPASLAHAMLSRTTVRPTFGLTLGIADILQSRRILLLVSGAAKRDPLARLLDGSISTQFPASLLSLHASVTLLCDI